MPSFALVGQSKAKSYHLFIGRYIFETTTLIDRDPVDPKLTREYSYLFKDERYTVKIPRRIDTITVYGTSHKKIRIDTVEQIQIHKVVDTINRTQLNELINSEIRIYSGSNKLKFDEAQFETIQPSGKTSYTIDLQRTKIKDGKQAFECVSKLDEGWYLILHTLWFYDSKKNRQEIECDIAWLIK